MPARSCALLLALFAVVSDCQLVSSASSSCSSSPRSSVTQRCVHTLVMYNRIPKTASSTLIWIMQERARSANEPLSVLSDEAFDQKGALNNQQRNAVLSIVARRVAMALYEHGARDATIVYEKHMRMISPAAIERAVRDEMRVLARLMDGQDPENAFRALAADCAIKVTYMNLVRDPVERALSRYAWDRGGDRPQMINAHYAAAARGEGVGDRRCPVCDSHTSASECLDRLTSVECTASLSSEERLRRIIGWDERQFTFFCDATSSASCTLSRARDNAELFYSAVGVTELWSDTLSHFTRAVPGGVFKWANATQLAWANELAITPLGGDASPERATKVRKKRRDKLTKQQLGTLLSLLGRAEIEFYAFLVSRLPRSR